MASVMNDESSLITADYLAEDVGGELIGKSVAFVILTTLFLALRFHSKKLSVAGFSGPFSLDDIFIVAAYCANLVMCGLAIALVHDGGAGRHIEFVKHAKPVALVHWAKLVLAFEVFYFASVALPKMALVFLFMRVFNWQGTMRTLAVIVQTVLACCGLSFIVAVFFQCTPLSYWWNPTLKTGMCFNVHVFFQVQSIPGLLLDVVVAAMPLHTIWGLGLPTAKKLGLMCIFAVGSIGVIASMIRTSVFFNNSLLHDRTFVTVCLVGWCVTETSVYIITGCLPCMKPLFSHYMPARIKAAARQTVSSATTRITQLARRSQERNERHELKPTASIVTTTTMPPKAQNVPGHRPGHRPGRSGSSLNFNDLAFPSALRPNRRPISLVEVTELAGKPPRENVLQAIRSESPSVCASSRVQADESDQDEVITVPPRPHTAAAMSRLSGSRSASQQTFLEDTTGSDGSI